MSPGIAIAVVPEEYYRKPRGVQFKKSFRKRRDALGYAEKHSCRVVIACGAGDRYDVLFDPESVPGPHIRFELVVDRGEMVAVPRLTPPQRKLPSLRPAPSSQARRPSLKIAWNSVHSWLNA